MWLIQLTAGCTALYLLSRFIYKPKQRRKEIAQNALFKADVVALNPRNSITEQTLKIFLGEGAIWDHHHQRLLFIDILKSRLFIYIPATTFTSMLELSELALGPIGTVVPCASSPYRFVVAVKQGLYRVEVSADLLQWKGSATLLANPEVHITNNRFNDGKCDPRGRLWAGTMSLAEKPGQGSLYSLRGKSSSQGFEVKRHLTDISISNGLIWSIDGKTMYYVDSMQHNVCAFDFDVELGEISNRRICIDVPKEYGVPDGITLDAAGFLWIAHWGGGCVTRWNVNATNRPQLVQQIRLPVSLVTSVAFGGPELDDLYITSAGTNGIVDVRSEESDAGSLFIVRNIGITGLSGQCFKD